jgi:sirohydrochlorin cobaltochelatase
MSKKQKLAYLFIAHGTRDREGISALFKFVGEFRETFTDRWVEPAFLDLSRPSIPEAIESCVEKGAEEIFILPLMFFPGRHIKKDIPSEILEAKRRFPQVDFHYAGALALASGQAGRFSEPKMFELLRSKIARWRLGKKRKVKGRD